MIYIKFFLIIFNILFCSAFSNNLGNMRNLSPLKIHWNNIFKYLDNCNGKYYNKKCIWFLNNLNNNVYSCNFIGYNYNFFKYHNNIIYNNNFIYNYKTNPFIFLLNYNIKLYVNKFFNNTLDLYIINPYNNTTRFNIIINYDNFNKLNYIILNRNSLYNSSIYWNDNDIIKIDNTTQNFNKNPFIFGSNYFLEFPLKINKFKNNNVIYNNKFPYLNYLKLDNNYDDIINLLLPNNINISIPNKLNNNNNNFEILWKFQNQLNNNILNINFNYSSGLLNYINYFRYI